MTSSTHGGHFSADPHDRGDATLIHLCAVARNLSRLTPDPSIKMRELLDGRKCELPNFTFIFEAIHATIIMSYITQT